MNNIKDLIDAVCAHAVYLNHAEEVGRCGTSSIFPENSLKRLSSHDKVLCWQKGIVFSIGILLSPPVFGILLIFGANSNSVLKSRIYLVQSFQRINL